MKAVGVLELWNKQPSAQGRESSARFPFPWHIGSPVSRPGPRRGCLSITWEQQAPSPQTHWLRSSGEGGPHLRSAEPPGEAAVRSGLGTAGGQVAEVAALADALTTSQRLRLRETACGLSFALNRCPM